MQVVSSMLCQQKAFHMDGLKNMEKGAWDDVGRVDLSGLHSDFLLSFEHYVLYLWCTAVLAWTRNQVSAANLWFIFYCCSNNSISWNCCFLNWETVTQSTWQMDISQVPFLFLNTISMHVAWEMDKGPSSDFLLFYEDEWNPTSATALGTMLWRIGWLVHLHTNWKKPILKIQLFNYTYPVLHKSGWLLDGSQDFSLTT